MKESNTFNVNHDDDEYGTRRGKPCRACTDFKSWIKQNAAKSSSHTSASSNSTSNSTSLPHSDKECPLDKDQLGRHTWAFIHTMAAYYPQKPSVNDQNDMKQFITIFSRFYPCDHCAEDLRKDINKNPPQTQSQSSLSQWWCMIHNKVNKKLGKPLFDCSKIDERWINGPSDGSCDQ